jgi:hypothetical protein
MTGRSLRPVVAEEDRGLARSHTHKHTFREWTAISLSAQRLKFSCKRPPERSEEGRLSAAISCSAALRPWGFLLLASAVSCMSAPTGVRIRHGRSTVTPLPRTGLHQLRGTDHVVPECVESLQHEG